MPPKNKTAATKTTAAHETASESSTDDDVDAKNKELVDEVLALCCGHLNGLPYTVVDEVLARLQDYCEKHRVTMTARSEAKKATKKKATKKSTKAKPAADPLWS